MDSLALVLFPTDRVCTSPCKSSGIMGLAWEPLAESGATPWWQTLIESGKFTQPLFGFYLTRYANASYVRPTEPGGSMDLGCVRLEYSFSKCLANVLIIALPITSTLTVR